MEVTMEILRDMLRGLCERGGRAGTKQLYEVLGLKTEKEKERLRRRLHDMVKAGELERVGDALYAYNFQYRPRVKSLHPIVWRFVRDQRADWWDIAKVCLMTRVSRSQVARYCAWLEEEGYIVRVGRRGQAELYKTTSLADQTPETPMPPIADADPFQSEKSAGARIIKILLSHDLYSPRAAREIVQACQVLSARFVKISTQTEKKEA